MPEGFNPHQELQRIYTLKEMMEGCRKMWPEIKAVLEDALSDDDIVVRLDAAKLALDRGFGKPRQSVSVTLESEVAAVQSSRRVLELPSNNRRVPEGRIIDA